MACGGTPDTSGPPPTATRSARIVISAPDTIAASTRTPISARLVDSTGATIAGGSFVFTVEEGAQYASVSINSELAGAPFVTVQPRAVRVAVQVNDVPNNVVLQERTVSKAVAVISRIASMRPVVSATSLLTGDTARLTLSTVFRAGAESGPPRDMLLWYVDSEFAALDNTGVVVARVMPSLLPRTARIWARTEGVLSDTALLTLVPPPAVERFQVRTVPDGLSNTLKVGTSRLYDVVFIGAGGAVLPSPRYSRADLLSQDQVTGITAGNTVFCEIPGVSEVEVFYPKRDGENPVRFAFNVTCVP